MSVPYKLYHGDCLEGMKHIKDHSIRAIITDLPYGTTKCAWDVIIPFEPLWEEVKRVLLPNGVFITTSNQPFTSLLITSNLEMYKHEWIWEKDGGSNFANVKREPMKEHDNVVVFSSGGWVYNSQMEVRIGSRKGKVTKSTYSTKTECYNKFTKVIDATVPELRNPRSIQRFIRERGLHPSQKPVALYEYLIKTYTNEGDIVLDICMGSGSCGEAALRTGRKFIGMEKDEKYFNIASDRIGKVFAELKG